MASTNSNLSIMNEMKENDTFESGTLPNDENVKGPRPPKRTRFLDLDGATARVLSKGSEPLEGKPTVISHPFIYSGVPEKTTPDIDTKVVAPLRSRNMNRGLADHSSSVESAKRPNPVIAFHGVKVGSGESNPSSTMPPPATKLFMDPLYPSPAYSVFSNADSFKGFSSDERRTDSETERSGRKSTSTIGTSNSSETKTETRNGSSPHSLEVVNFLTGLNLAVPTTPAVNTHHNVKNQSSTNQSQVLKQFPGSNGSNVNKRALRSRDKIPKTRKSLPVDLTETAAIAATEVDKTRKKKRKQSLGAGCKCSKSRCLKLYCACFSVSAFCDSLLCTCKGCLNLEENNGPNGARTAAVDTILARRPDAFDERPKKIGEGCSCKKNQCLKLYCNCLAESLPCSPDKCKCKNCKNSVSQNTETPPAFLLRQGTPASGLIQSAPQELASFSDLLELSTNSGASLAAKTLRTSSNVEEV